MKGMRPSFFFLLLTFNSLSYALPPNLGALLPGSTEPGVIGKNLSAPPITAPFQHKKGPAVKEEKQAESKLGPQATKIKFKLNKIILDGNKVYSEAQLRKIYQDK